MSGIALSFRPDPSMPVHRADLEAMLRGLDHRGPDGRRVTWECGAALGHQHFWTTPEELGERQPVVAEDGCVVAFDGRLDNRAELLRRLGGGVSGATSDAVLVAQAHARWGAGCFERLLGPFAVAILDPRRHRLVCARDALGDRTLVYHWDGESFLAASEEQALLRHPRVSEALDEETVARFFALRAARSGATFFADVRELPAGHYLTLEDGRLQLCRYWEPQPGERLSYGSDVDYATRFRQLLDDSVRCRLRSPVPPSVLMSGGLDSTAVASTAAAQLEEWSAAPLRTVSWVFDELAQQDERRYMDPVVESCGLAPIRLPGDGAWPLRDLASWTMNPSAPLRDLYRLRETAYAASAAAGSAVMLTGDFGDNLYFGCDFWLRGLLREGRYAEAASIARIYLSADPAAGASKLREMAKALSRAVGWTGRTPRTPRWITPRGVELLGGDSWLREARSARRLDQYRVILDPVNAQAASQEQGNANRLGVELRFPFRDRRLIRFVLSIPAHQIYRPGWFKWLLRQAMRGRLPTEVRQRRDHTCLLPLCARGLVEREWGSVVELLESPAAIWPRYVSAEWLWRGFPAKLRAGRLSLETVVAWRCICMELWQRARRRGRPEHESCRVPIMSAAGGGYEPEPLALNG